MHLSQFVHLPVSLFLLCTLLLSGLGFGSSEKLADTPSCCLGALPTNLLAHSTPTSASVCIWCHVAQSSQLQQQQGGKHKEGVVKDAVRVRCLWGVGGFATL